MQEQLQNTPFKLVSDKDEVLYDIQEAFELDNVRIEEKDGFFLVNLKEENEAFRIKSDYKIVGIAFFNGIYYVVAYSANANKVMAGSYPSVNPSTNKIDKVFRPFQTYTKDKEYINRTTCYYKVDVTAEPLYIDNIGIDLRRIELKVYNRNDGSVNILGLHPNGNFILNSGFNKDGYTKKGYINDADLREKTYLQLNESVVFTKANIEVLTNGSLKAGTYTFYARYKSLNGGVTSYRKISKPVQIFNGSATTPANPPHSRAVYGETNKALKVDFLNTSDAYPFLELAVLYQYGESEKFMQAYTIPYDVFKDNDYIVFNHDYLIPAELGILAANKTTQKGCLTGTIINNRFIGAHWYGKDNYHQDICDYVSKIEIKEDYFLITDRDEFEYDIIESKATHSVDMPRSYFSGETYAFLAHPMFKDGTIGLGYPMKGMDNWHGGNNGPTNDRGIFRFSNAVVKPIRTTNYGPLITPVGTIYGKRPKFDLTIANSFITQWLSDNVIGFVFSQARRNPNMIYQGFVARCYNGNVLPDSLQNNDTYKNLNKYIPLVEPKSFSFYYDKRLLSFNDPRYFLYGKSYLVQNNSLDNHVEPTEYKYGLFSTDYMIDENINLINGNGNVLMKIGDCVIKEVEGRQVAVNSELMGWHVQEFAPSKEFYNINTFNVGAWSAESNNKYTGKVEEGNISSGWYFFDNNSDRTRQYNLSFGTPGYIGIEERDNADQMNIEHSLCAIYKTHPEQINVNDVYNIEAEQYALSNVLTTFDRDIYILEEGDCFPQRSTFKVVNALDYSTQLLEDMSPGLTNYLGNIRNNEDEGFGLFLSILSENTHNAQGRVVQGGNLCYPAVNLDSLVYTLNQPESFFYNYGYDKNDLYTFVKYSAINFSTDNVEGNLIAHSDKQTAESNIDAFRTILAGEQKTYNLNEGNIYKIFNANNNLIVLHEEATYLVAIDERVPINEGSNVVLGNTTFLNEQTQKLGMYGTQHLFGACQDNYGAIYALDINKQMIWRFVGQLEPLSQVKQCIKATQELIFGDDNNPLQSLYLDGFDQDYLYVNFDSKFKEIEFTVNNNGDRNLVFSTTSNEFVGKRSSAYVKLSAGELKCYDNNKCYLPYGTGYKDVVSKIGFISTDRLHRQFHSHWVMSVQEDLGLKNIDWETNFQKAFTIVDVAPHWYKPVFRNGMWFIPIPRNVIANARFKEGSVMSGDYLKTTLNIQQTNKIELKLILTSITRNIG